MKKTYMSYADAFNGRIASAKTDIDEIRKYSSDIIRTLGTPLEHKDLSNAINQYISKDVLNETEEGLREVKHCLNRIEFGNFS
jgi:hypothetical protein